MTSQAQLIGQSSHFLDAIERASAAAVLNRPVLVVGERGTGKELIAERLHRLSPRWSEPLISLNCAALPENLLDAELFGHESGAFTGATKARAGRFEEANGGTLFLDEIGTLSASAQERLLRVVEYGVFSRLGSTRTLKVDVRIVAATNEDLPSLAEQGRFRSDLLDRLSFEVITLPPLRARQDDIPILVDHFGRRMASELGWKGFKGFTARALEQLNNYDWPGNIRELKNVVERSVYRWGDDSSPIGAIDTDPFDSPWRPHGAFTTSATNAVQRLPAPQSKALDREESEPEIDFPVNYRDKIANQERKLLSGALEKAKYNQRHAAQLLNLSYDQIRHAMKKHGLL